MKKCHEIVNSVVWAPVDVPLNYTPHAIVEWVQARGVQQSELEFDVAVQVGACPLLHHLGLEGRHSTPTFPFA